MRPARAWSMLAVGALVLVAGLAPATAAAAPVAFSNASIADVALKYVGTWGGEACRDAQRSGLTGSTTSYPVVPQRDPATGRVLSGHEGDGQCRAFVNCVVELASAGTVWLGGGGGDYFQRFREVGAKAITRVDDLRKGDIVQEGNGVHTYIVLSRVEGEVFDIVDSNGNFKETVLHRHRRIVLDDTRRAYRLGAIEPGGAHSPYTSPYGPGFKVSLGAGSYIECNVAHGTLECRDYGGPLPPGASCSFGGTIANVKLSARRRSRLGFVCVDEGYHGWAALPRGKRFRSGVFSCVHRARYLSCGNGTHGFRIDRSKRIRLR